LVKGGKEKIARKENSLKSKIWGNKARQTGLGGRIGRAGILNTEEGRMEGGRAVKSLRQFQEGFRFARAG